MATDHSGARLRETPQSGPGAADFCRDSVSGPPKGGRAEPQLPGARADPPASRTRVPRVARQPARSRPFLIPFANGVPSFVGLISPFPGFRQIGDAYLSPMRTTA